MRRALWLSLLLCACDDSPDVVARAKGQYQTLIDQQALATDTRFDLVLAELAKVKPDERAYKEAQRLTQAIQRSRGPQVKAPLATGGSTGDSELDGLKSKCAAFASQVGTLSGEAREAKLKELDACQREVIALDLKKAHELEGADGG